MEDAPCSEGPHPGGGGPVPPAGFDPEVLVGWTLVRAYQVMARRFQAVFTEVGLTPTHFGVLSQLASHPGTSQAALARGVFLTPQSVGELLAALQERGLVSRQENGPGLPTSVVLTDAGREALRRAIPAVVAVNQPETLGLSEEQAATLNELLHVVRRTLSDGG